MWVQGQKTRRPEDDALHGGQMAEGVFENNWFLNVPRENAPRLIHLFLNVPCGTITLKQGRLEKIPKYSPHCSLCSKGRRIFVLFSNFSISTNTGRKPNEL